MIKNSILGIGRLVASCLALTCISPQARSAESASFTHPGITHTQASIDFVGDKIASGEEPWAAAWKEIQASRYADLEWQPQPRAHVERGPYNKPNIGSSEFSSDANAAYLHALQWALTGKAVYAKKAAEILNSWSSTLETVTNHDARLLVGMEGYDFCNAAELLKYTWDGWPEKDQVQFEKMLRGVFYPVIKDFYPSANGNWDASMLQTMLAMGVYLDDQAMFDRGVEYYLNGKGNGAVRNYFKPSGQCQESGRDQAHTQMGLDFLACTCEIAWNQGIDLYGAYENRLFKGFEYTAKYNLGFDVPYEPYRSFEGRYHYKSISDDSRGRLRPMYEKVLNHFENRKGHESTFTRQAAMALRESSNERRAQEGRRSRRRRSSALDTLMFAGLSASAAHDRVGSAADAKERASSKMFNVLSFGAVGDGVAMETVAVQAAIDACHEAGGGIVRLPSGDFQIGTIILKSNVTLSLDYGASILGSLNKADYTTEGIDDPREGGPHCLIYANGAHNVAIEGLGTIDGRGTHENFPRLRSGGRNRGFRPRLLRMFNCDGLRFAGNTWKRPAFWGLHLIDCKNVAFDAVTIRFRNNNYNNDGLDLDGCENVRIENCDIDSGDDAICLKSSKNPCRNIVVRGCKVSSNTAPLKFGTSSRGGFIDVEVSNCYFYNSPMGAIKLQLVDGGSLENVEISRITMEEVGCPLFIRLGNRGNTFGSGEKPPVGTIKNIRIRDVTATVTIEDREAATKAVYKNLKVDTSPGITDREKAKAGPIMITGIPGHSIENVTLENVTMSFPGHGTAADASRVIPEDETRYPEQFFFGVLPSWGAFIRHARNIEFKNVQLTLRASDERERIVLDDVEGFVNH